ncbi:MAG: OmpA family protein [Deltaproteobacteria bacterium]|nr:OmpA family protein [Deltaproteobacteria bacterium]
MDKEKRPLFVSGQPRLTPPAQQILGVLADRLKTIPNKISIEGHTDAVTTVSQQLTNWELSTARASAARRLLARLGIGDERLTMVAGFAATRPLPETSPLDPINRRISIMIWDEGADIAQARPGAPPPPETPPAAPPPPAAGSPPAAGAAPATPQARPAGPPAAPPRATRPMPQPERPSQQDLEQRLLEDTLSRAAAPEGTTTGPPVAEQPPQQ